MGGVTDLVELVWCFRVWCFLQLLGVKTLWVLALCFVFCFVLLVLLIDQAQTCQKKICKHEARRETKHTQVNFAEL